MPTTPPSITALPTAPDPNDRGTFNARAYPWSAALSTWTTQVQAVAANVKANADEAEADATTAAAQVALAETQAGNAASSATLAQAWASQASTPVGGGVYSAKYYAELAQTVVATIPTGTINDGATSGASVWSSSKVSTELGGKQNTLVSGTSIKTINSTSLLGSGDVAVQPTLVSGTNIKTIGGASILGSGDLTIAAGITATGTAAESVVAGDPLAWRSSDNKLEKVKRVRETPYVTDSKQHLIVVCPYVDGNTRINNGSGSTYKPRYSIFDSTVLCAWSEYVLDINGTQTAKMRACAGVLQDDGTVSWGAPSDVTFTGSTDVNVTFDCVVLSATLGGVVGGTVSALKYTIINISGNTITSASSSGSLTAARNLYLDRRGLFRISATHAGLVCHSGGNNTASAAVVINFTSTGGHTFDDNSSLRTYSDGLAADFCGGNSIGGRLSVNGSGPGAMYIFRTSGTTFAETTVVGSNVQAQSCALGFDGTRYFVATYISSADSRTYAVCIDSTGWSVGTPVQVSTTGFWRMGIWFDAETSTFYLINPESSGSVYPITRTSGTTLSVGSLTTGIDPFRERSAPSFSDLGRIGYTQCGTSKFFAVCGTFVLATSPTYVAYSGIALIPYAPTNAGNYVGIADAAAVTNATVTYTPHGGVTTRMTGLTPFRATLLSHAGVVGSSGFQRAGLALSATAMQVHTPQNDFSKVEVWTASGTWTCPNHVTKVHLREVTGGGAGAFSGSMDRYSQGGESVSGYFDVVPGQTYTITIGAGGTSSTTASSVTGGGNTAFGPVIATGGLHEANSIRTTSQLVRKTRTPITYVQNCTIRRKGGVLGGYLASNDQYGGGAGIEATDFGRAGGSYFDGSTITINGTQGVVIFAY